MSNNEIISVLVILFMAFLLGYAAYKMGKQDYQTHDKQ